MRWFIKADWDVTDMLSADILTIEASRRNVSEILMKTQRLSYKKKDLKMSLWRQPFYLGFNILIIQSVPWTLAGPILGLRPANERRRYFVTTSLTDWAQA